jgi:hypothetical protein
MRLLRRFAVIGSLMSVLVALSPGAAPPAIAAACDAVLGFRMLQQTIPSIVGECTAAPYIDPRTRDVVQATTRGTLIKRANNAWPYFWVYFTNGTQTYVMGPHGLQVRDNDVRFAWEANPLPQPFDLPTVAAYQGYVGPWDPYFPQRACTDFRTQDEAQGFFLAGGDFPIWDPRFRDRHNLDPERDGWACGSPPGFGPASSLVPPVPPVMPDREIVTISGLGDGRTERFRLMGAYDFVWEAEVREDQWIGECDMSLRRATLGDNANENFPPHFSRDHEENGNDNSSNDNDDNGNGNDNEDSDDTIPLVVEPDILAQRAGGTVHIDVPEDDYVVVVFNCGNWRARFNPA